MEPLDSNAMMLGALRPDLFDAELSSILFQPSDNLIAYTDGAIECRNQRDDELRVEGFRAMVAAADSHAILDQTWQSLQRFRHGPAEDDVLVLHVSIGDIEAYPRLPSADNARLD